MSTGAVGAALHMTVFMLLGLTYGFISMHRTEQTGQRSEHVYVLNRLDEESGSAYTLLQPLNSLYF